MSEQIEVPARKKRGAGCCGTGCFLIVLLALASAGGLFWGVHHLQDKYLETHPVELPEVVTADEPAAIESAPLAAVAPTPARMVEQNWKAFEKAKDRDEKARIELSAGEINALIQSHKNTRGKAFVSIENNIAHVRLSIPLKKVPLLSGRYLNGEASVEASPDGDPKKARVSNIVLAGNSVSEGILNQRMFGISSVRSVVLGWLDEQGITGFRIENDRAIGEKESGR